MSQKRRGALSGTSNGGCQTRELRIGVDFDNTLVSYDRVFRTVAAERGFIPADSELSRIQLRNELRRTGREKEWRELQGLVYGPHMNEAAAFPGALAFLARCRALRISVMIVSHRTRVPACGPRYDLHASGKKWLMASAVASGLVPAENIFFETSRAEKLARIAGLGLSYFVDDLVEVVAAPDFPSGVERILFDPLLDWCGDGPWKRVTSWSEVELIVTEWVQGMAA